MSDQYATTAILNRREVTIRAMEHADLAVIVELDALAFGSMRSSYFKRRLTVLDATDADARR